MSRKRRVLKQTPLARYIDTRINFWAKLTNSDDLVKWPPNADEARRIIGHLAGDLSPENLHCDGEITAAAARAKYNEYMKVIDELAELGHDVSEITEVY